MNLIKSAFNLESYSNFYSHFRSHLHHNSKDDETRATMDGETDLHKLLACFFRNKILTFFAKKTTIPQKFFHISTQFERERKKCANLLDIAAYIPNKYRTQTFTS